MTLAAHMTTPATRLDYSYRVLDELNLQLGQLRQRTVAFVDTGDQQSRSELSGFVKKTAQTLELIDCKGARLLTQELYLLLNAMADGQVVDGIDAAPVLVLASEKLSEYLDYLRVGGLDIPLALLPLLNDMRACRGESLLSEALIVSPVFEIPETSDALVRGDTVAAEFFRVIRETKLPLMQCVLRWLRNHTVSQNLRKLVKLLDSLEQTSPSAALQDLWLAARALCVSMLDGSLEDSVAIRVLFGQMERFVSQLSEADFQASDTTPGVLRTATPDAGLLRLPSGLFKNMLYYIALSRSTDERVTKMQQSYRLNELLPPKAMLDSARDALGGPNAQLSDAICASIGRELSEIKSTVSGLSASAAVSPSGVESEQMLAGAHKLEQVASTFLLLGIQGADNVARSASRRLDALGLNVGSNVNSADVSDNLPALASELLQLEAAVEEYRHTASTTPVFADTFARDMLEQRRLSSFQFDQIVAACLGEARDILGNVETAYLASIKEDRIQEDRIQAYAQQADAVDEPRMQWQRSRLVDAADQLHTVKMALQILPLPELEPLLGGAARYLLASAKSTETISEHLHIAFADLMVNTQTYLDAQIQRQSSASDLLGSAELALDTLYDAMDTVDSSDSTWELASTLEVSAASVADAHNPLTLQSHPLSAQDSPMLEVFTEEALQQLELINQSLVRWQDNADPFALQDLRRSYHTLKGSGYVAGAAVLADFAAAHETMLGSVIDHAVDVPQQVDELMLESAAVLPQLIYSMQSDDATVEGVAELNSRLYSVASGISAGSGMSQGGMQNSQVFAEGESEFHEHTLALGMVADELAQTSVIDTHAGFASGAFMPADADEHDKTQDLSEVLDQRSDLRQGVHATSPSVSHQGLSLGESATLPGDLPGDLSGEFPGDLSAELYDDETLRLDSVFEQNPFDQNPGDADVDRSAVSSLLDQSGDVTQQINSAFTAASPVPPQAGVSFDNNNTPGNADQEHEFTWSDNVDPDSTLFRVFETETRTHLGTLRRVLDYALRHDSPSVPDELLARTLHTMHGSARAAEVEAIASLVSPLEEIAAYRLRTGRVLELSQWTRFAEVVDAIEHNLDLLADGPVALHSADTHTGVGIVSVEQLDLQDLQQPSMTPTAGPRTDLAEVFLLEAAGLFETIQHSVNELENNQHEQTTQGVEKIILRDILRPLHTLKGSARVSGCNEIADLAHVLESSLLSWQDSERGADQKRRDLLQESIDALTLNLEQAAANATQGHFDLLINELNRDVTDSEQSVYTDEMPDDLPDELPDELLGQTLQMHGDLPGFGFVEPDVVDAATSGDGLEKIRAVYRQGQPDFELTAELPVADSTMQLSDKAIAPLLSPASGNNVASTKIPRKANGQVRLDAQLLDNLSSLSTDVSLHHVQLSDGLFAFRDTLTDLDKTTSRLREKLRELDMETDMLPDSTVGDTGSEQSRQSAEELERTVHFNPLLPDAWQRTEEDSRQLSEILSDLDNIRDTMHSQLRLAEETLSHTSRLGSDIHESLLRSRLVRFDLHLHRLGSVVRQTARSVGRQAELELLGGQTAIDRDMHNALLVPLEHLLRNAVSHGIENASVREKKNKSSSGKIAINVCITGSDLCIDVSDDGAGIDYAALRRTLMLPGATEQELHSALFRPGFSTAQQATQISGRGIGLDSTRAAVTALGGRLELSSQLDAGTRIRIRIPQRVVINQVVLVELDGNLFGIPVNFVQQVLPVEPLADSVADKGSREYGGKSYSILGLHELPGFALLANSDIRAQAATAGQIEQEILIEASGHLLALRAGRIIGFRELITRPPGRQLSKLGFYSGVSVLASGQVALMLDLDQLLEFQFDQTLSLSAEHPLADVGARMNPDIDLMQQRLSGSSANPPAAVRASATVLVVDDSVTMRTYAKRILEGAGLQCRLARDGVEAMESLETDNLPPDVILLDIEMPRMDGFQLLQRLRETPARAQIPVIMISSRTGEANRQKATELGVVAYLGKPYQASELLTVLESRLRISCHSS